MQLRWPNRSVHTPFDQIKRTPFAAFPILHEAGIDSSAVDMPMLNMEVFRSRKHVGPQR